MTLNKAGREGLSGEVALQQGPGVGGEAASPTGIGGRGLQVEGTGVLQDSRGPRGWCGLSKRRAGSGKRSEQERVA